MNTSNEKLLFAAEEAAQLLGISRSKLYELKAEGKVPAPVNLGKRVFWRKEELLDWVNASCPDRLEWERMRDENKAS